MYDVFVIGGGPGGYVSAIRLAKNGFKVGLAEEKWLGGTCTNVGCIPTKALLFSSKIFSRVKEAKKFGITLQDPSISLSSVITRKDKVVLRLRKGIEYLLKKNKIDLFMERAKIVAKNKVLLEKSGKEIEAKNIIIATGSGPIKFPPFTDEDIWVSDDIFSLKEQPKSLVIIGGGVIGVEMATFFSTIGTEVKIVEIMPHILPTEDEDLAEAVRKNLTKKGVEIFESAKTEKVEKNGNGFKLYLDINGEKKEIEGEKVLLSVGRKANMGEDIEALGIETYKKGIVTDERMRTNVEGIYAVGDINGKFMLAHVAMKEGIVAADNISGKEAKMDYSAVPSVIFTDPEISVVGKREWELKKEGVEYKTGIFPVSASGKARTMEESEGFCKVIIDKEEKKILGIQMFAPEATDMVMESVMSIQFGFSPEKLLEAIHPHPTMTEIVMEATEAALGKSLHI